MLVASVLIKTKEKSIIMMNRSTAREIAARLAYELSFTQLTVEELLEQNLSPERFSSLADEDELYQELHLNLKKPHIHRIDLPYSFLHNVDKFQLFLCLINKYYNLGRFYGL